MSLKELKDEIVRCRTYGHAWDEIPAGKHPSKGWGEAYGRIILRCVRCTTERYDYLDWRGEVMGRNYDYPPGYSQAGGIKRPDFRLELIRRNRSARRRANSTRQGLRKEAS